MKQPTKAALYMRLSRDDDNFGDSISIETQRKILRAYVRANHIPVVDEYIDDGFSGTTFDRPAFQSMMTAIDEGKVNWDINGLVLPVGTYDVTAVYSGNDKYNNSTSQITLIVVEQNEEYEILPSEGGYTLSRYEMVYGEGTAKRRLTDSAACSSEEVLALLNDCQVMKWDGFDGPHPKGVLDGTMFRFDARVNDGKSIQAQGSQNFPKHFHDFEQGLYTLLSEKGETHGV